MEYALLTWLRLEIGKKGQNCSSFGVLGLVCLNFSMFRRLLENLNFVSACVVVMFLISSRYFSHPISVLLSAYTVNTNKIVTTASLLLKHSTRNRKVIYSIPAPYHGKINRIILEFNTEN